MNDTIRKIIIWVIYVVLAIVVILLIPALLTFSLQTGINTMFWNSGAGALAIKAVQIFVGMLFLIVPLIVVGKNGGFNGSKASKLTRGENNQGSATKGKLSDLRGLTVPVNGKGGGYTLSKKVRLSAEKSYEHVAIIGPTGAGKSTSFFIPTLLDADGTHSFVVTDPKGELHRLCGPYLKSLGMEVVKIDPLGSTGGSDYLYNPLLIAEDFTQIRELAQLILVNGAKTVEIQMGGQGGGGQAEWINMSTPLFAAALAWSRKFGTKKSINEAIDICLNIGETAKDLAKAEELFKKDPIAHKNYLIFKSAGGSEKTVSSIKSVLTSNIQLFLDDKVEMFVRTPSKIDKATGKKVIDYSKLFDPRKLREKPMAVFVCVPETKSDYMAPLMSVFYSQLLTSNMNYFDNDKYKTPILYLLDEFANIGIIPLIATIAATARSRKLGLSIGIQGVDQLDRNYGKENAQNLLNNLKEEMGLTIMFIAHDLSVVKYFCDRIAVMYFGNIVELASSDELFAHPLHPYTRALLSAIPKPDPLSEKERKRYIYVPANEHDYSQEAPKLVEITPGHFVMANSEELEKYRKVLNEKK